MRTLFFGAGPIGILYSQILTEAGKDISILARGAAYRLIDKRELILVDGFGGESTRPALKVIDQLTIDDNYDLVVVAVSKSSIPSVLTCLSRYPDLNNILFLGNNVAGFDSYQSMIPNENILFGFPGAGGGWRGQILEMVDRESPKSSRIPLRIGEADGVERLRTREIRDFFASGGIPVELVKDIDGWLKYHAAFVIPIGCAIYRHGGDLNSVAADRQLLVEAVLASKEAGNVLKKLGYSKRQPFKFNLFYWCPPIVTVKMFQKMFSGRFAQVAFAMHALSAREEFQCLVREFQSLADQAQIEMPHFNELADRLG